MPGTSRDPYTVLGVPPDITDEGLRDAYRRLAVAHHPDHNGGSVQSAARFAAIQGAYDEIRRRRAGGRKRAASSGPATDFGRSEPVSHGTASGSPRPGERAANARPVDSRIDSRIEEMESELRAAQRERDRAAAAARQAAAEAAADGQATQRPTDEELGYIRTDDSFTKIIADAARDLSGLYTEARQTPVGRTVEDLVDEVLDRITRRPPDDPR